VISHREALRLLFVAVWRSTGAFLSALGAIILIVYGSLGPPSEPKNEGLAYYLHSYFDPCRIHFGLILLVVAAYMALRSAVSDLQHKLRAVARRRDQLEELLKPRAEIVLIPGCCIQSTLVAIGVAAKPVKSLRTASVYVDIPGLGLKNRVLAWANPKPDPERTLDIHHGQHHHTEWIAIVGDPPANQFLLSLGYGNPYIVGAGPHEITVYVKGRDAMVTEAKLEIIFTPPRGVSARLL